MILPTIFPEDLLTARFVPADQYTNEDHLVKPLYSEFLLKNGLRVILHRDNSTPIVSINILYHVGSKNEAPGRTGFAHLFEHLMFDGSKNIQRGDYDRYCTLAGGENNAYTSSDITDYHITLPVDKLALGLWLESDRMAEFAIEEISLETQKNVVTEEKLQTTDNTPYGALIATMRELAYAPEHPYSWETIGSEQDIAAATMADVREFYQRFYTPSNAVLAIAGDFEQDEAKALIQQYFDDIPTGPAIERPQPNAALLRTGGIRQLHDKLVPFNAVFLGYHSPSCYHHDCRVLELLSDMLSEGESSRLYKALEYEQEIASETESFVDEGELGSLFYVYAIAQNNSIRPEQLEAALLAEIEELLRNGVSEEELQKVKNRKTTRIARLLQSGSNRAERLAYFSLLFNSPALAFSEADMYTSITTADVVRVAQEVFTQQQPTKVQYIAPRKKRR